MLLPTTRLALERLLLGRARQRAANIVRAKDIAEKMAQVGTAHIAEQRVLRQYNAVAVKHLVAAGKRRGYVTYAEANSVLPRSGASEEDMVAIINAIFDLGFDLKEC
jgi:hypothetical protein